MDKPTKGIPTVYKGIQFRSRLESRWAAFFDLLGWPWQYEPFDLDGWIPDFLIDGAHPVLIEVKPVTSLPMDIASEITSATQTPFIPAIVGCTLILDEDYHPSFRAFLGWILCSGCGQWSPFGVGKFDGGSSAPGLLASQSCAMPSDFVSGHKSDDRMGFNWVNPSATWNRAGNLTQWRGKQSIVRS